MAIRLKSNTGLPLIEANHPDDAGELNPFWVLISAGRVDAAGAADAPRVKRALGLF
jgi:hypothetical protein